MRRILIALVAILGFAAAFAFGYFSEKAEWEQRHSAPSAHVETETVWSFSSAHGLELLAALRLNTAITAAKTCPANGTTTPTVTLNGTVARWMVTAEVETVYMCCVGDCADGGSQATCDGSTAGQIGQPIFTSVPLVQDIAAGSTIACRSPTGTGVLRFTAAKFTP